MLGFFNRRPWAAVVVVGALIALSLPLQRSIDHARGRKAVIRGTLYMSSAALKRLSLGYDEVLADLYWLRALQYFGGSSIEELDPQELYKYFDIITDLDPGFVNAYRYGGTFLADLPPIGLGATDLGIKLYDKGRANLPDNFRIPLEEAFIWMLYKKDYRKAAELFSEAASKPGLSDFRRASLRGMAALALSRGGKEELARRVWLYIYENSSNEGRRKFALRRLNEIESRRLERMLTEKAREFERLHGRLPNDVEELVAAGLIDRVPSDPMGGTFIVAPRLRGIRSSALVDEELLQAAGFLTARAQRFKTLYGRYPSDLDELKRFVLKDKTVEFPKHPLGEEFRYDPETGTVKDTR